MQPNAALCGAPEAAPHAQPPGPSLDELEQALTPLQLRAIALILLGNTIASVAAALGVARSTIFRWQRQEAFAAVLRFRRELVFGEAVDGLRAMLVTAVQYIREEMRSEHRWVRVQTAYRLLPYVGSIKLRPMASSGVRDQAAAVARAGGGE